MHLGQTPLPSSAFSPVKWVLSLQPHLKGKPKTWCGVRAQKMLPTKVFPTEDGEDALLVATEQVVQRTHREV